MRFDVEKLAQAITEKRGKTGLRAVAKVTGVSAATLSRIGSGETPNLEHAVALCAWLGRPVDDFVTPSPLLKDVAKSIYDLWNQRKLNSEIEYITEVSGAFDMLRDVLKG